jgi:integrase
VAGTRFSRDSGTAVFRGAGCRRYREDAWQGELLALRWRDIDWTAGRVRVMYEMRKKRRRKTKSRSSRRSVPMADRVAGGLDQLFKASAYQSAEDLVFGHPHTGRPLDRTSVTVRF